MSERKLLGYPIMETPIQDELPLSGMSFGDWSGFSPERPCDACGSGTRHMLCVIDKDTGKELRRYSLCGDCVAKMFPGKVNE